MLKNNIYNNKHYIMQLIWLLKEEKKYYNNYDDNYLNNHIEYIESMYKLVKILENNSI